MSKREIWAKRVAGWRGSGLTSTQYCEGRDFTAGGLRHWAHLLSKERDLASPKALVPMARVLRVSARPLPAALATKPQREPSTSSALVLDAAGVRVIVPPGFDRETLAELLDLLLTRGAAS